MEIKLSEWQTKVWDDDHRYKVINCGRRAGKSTLSALKLAMFASENPGSTSWMVAPTYRQAKMIIWTMLKGMIPPQAIESTNESELVVTLKNGSRIELKGAENPDGLRGVRIDFAVFDEVAFIQKWGEVWKVMRPTLSDSEAEVWFISTPNGFNHFKALADKDHEDWQYCKFTTYDNPVIPRAEIEKMREEMSEDAFMQEMMGEFRRMQGLIYKNFDREVHMVDIPRLDDSYTYFRAIDFGFSHKTAVGYFAVNSIGTEIYMYDGIYLPGVTVPDIAAAMNIKDAGRFFTLTVADSAQPTMIQELNMQGLDVVPVRKGADSVKNGIQKVAELLKIRNDLNRQL